ncbi:GMC family oxidoreductase N-terminal domain-containing protein [Paenibacillus sp. LHD-38]|uniref:GMC family oxidoreductase N-terminal domain-containing protein n=1 Tax=Paenibacillus sp. LHD-38 TaxID=3072143 RepID=UPI00280D0B59|nr:GMC family oxidoreductase N-terminal domain-containing protein [Paenibacillus sp. LHD-38]MDQ8737163.1 GMC family oxidoreductase N-terminal domain-containing protein [Paenibacillus sp. LHD-38]
MFWDAAATRIESFLQEEWPIPLHELESYYETAERIMKVSDNFFEGAQLTEILLSRMKQNGFPEAVRMPMAADLKPSTLREVHSDVMTSSISFFSKALNARPFDLAVQSRAIRLLVDHGKVTGVQVMSPDKRSFTLKGKTVVLSASTFERPRLLLYSNIQTGAVGHYLMNQSFLSAKGTVDRKAFPE